MDLLEHDYGDTAVTEHLRRIRSACFDNYDLNDVVRYIEEKTYLNGDKFSFKDHEFQKDIISDTSQELNVQKCAQVGLSEVMARYALAICRVMPYFSTILTMPGAKDAENFFKTRINAVINDSPDLRDNLDSDIDNTSMKGFGGSILYGRGTRGSTAALSVPADLLIHDELDRSDPHTIQQYVSRLKHSKHKMIRRFGTPMYNGMGIALAMTTSMRKHHMCKCHRCGHDFVPNYHKHVVIPGWDKPKQELDSYNLGKIDWESSYLACPKCGKEPSLLPEHRQWVVENTHDSFAAKGYYVTPFSAPNVVPISRIVKESTLFLWHEFCNQTLGETASSETSTLVLDDIKACKYTSGSLEAGNLHAMGVDIGHTCYFTVGRRVDGRLLVVHRERCSLAKVKEVRERLMERFRVITSVWDWQPETSLILGLQETDQNLYAGRYKNIDSTSTFTIQTKEQSLAEGQLPLKMALINREVHFDNIMFMFKNRKILWAAQDDVEDALFEAQLLDMQRTLQPDQHGEGRYKWVKAENDQDHYHHSLGYLDTACQLMETASTNVAIVGMPLFAKVKAAPKKEPRGTSSLIWTPY